mmetsp:Transcript_2688/g.5806  ORF Transcript_2688/g.5806 Transcript_2688/m.5806 type:complete len:227 (-) Transcript_2688:32-712(-)
MTPFYINDNFSAFNFDPVCTSIRPLHIFFIFVLNKTNAPRFSFLVGDKFNVFDWSKCLHFSQQFSSGHLVSQPSNKQRIVTIHSLVFTATISLEFSVFVNHRFTLVVEKFGSSLYLCLFQRFRRRLDGPFGGRRFFKLIHELEETLRWFLSSFAFDGRKLSNRGVWHESSSNVGRHHHHGWLCVASRHLALRGHLTATHRCEFIGTSILNKFSCAVLFELIMIPTL